MKKMLEKCLSLRRKRNLTSLKIYVLKPCILKDFLRKKSENNNISDTIRPHQTNNIKKKHVKQKHVLPSW